MAKYYAIADLHGKLDEVKIKECDYLIICGDIIPSDIQHNMTDSKRFFKNKFIPWCLEQPCKQVIFIAGNHDAFLEKKSEDMVGLLGKYDKENKIQYLPYNDKLGGTFLQLDGHWIYGTPMCSIFGNWSFMYKHIDQTEKFCNAIKFIQEENIKLDMIISHDAPYGVSDVLEDDNPWGNTQHLGNTALKNFLLVAQPQILVHGHLHSSSHNWEQFGNTNVINASLLNDKYKKVYNPIYFEL